MPKELQEMADHAKSLVNYFPKLDNTAELALKKNRTRENSYSIDASYQPAPLLKKHSPANSGVREMGTTQKLNIYLANTINSARYSKASN